MKASDNPFPSFLVTETAAGSIGTPGAGDQHLFIDTDHILKYKNSGGTVSDVGTGGSSGLLTKLYDYTVSGSDKASIDTNVDGSSVANFTGHDILTWYVLARTDAAGVSGTLDIILNNDSGAKYTYQEIVSNNTTTTSGGGVAGTSLSYFIRGSGGTAGYASLLTFVCLGYESTTFFKTFRFDVANNDGSTANQRLEINAFTFLDTAAITRIKVFGHSTEKLKVGSRLVVYGQ